MNDLTPQERRKLLDTVDAVIATGAAVAEETRSLKKGCRVALEGIVQLIDDAVRSGMSRAAVQAFIGDLNLMPSHIMTAILLFTQPDLQYEDMILGPDGERLMTREQWEALRAEWDQHRRNAGPRRLHSGGDIGSAEELIVGEAGERVLSRRQWDALRAEYNKPRRRLTRWLKRRWKR